MRDLEEMHSYTSSVKEYIQNILDDLRYRKKWYFSKKIFHIKYNPVLGTIEDVRRARNIIYNPKKFEQFFNDQCKFLQNRINHNLINYELRKGTIYSDMRKECEEAIKRIISEQTK